jgi:DNA-binding MarR family transcriptional regulator
MQATFTNGLLLIGCMSASRAETTAEETLSESEYRERLRDLPPSAKLVAKVLEGDAPLSQGQLADESLLPDRTVRYALNRLEEVDLVGSRYSFEDARKQVYYLRT